MLELPNQLTFQDAFWQQNVILTCHKYSLTSVQITESAQSLLDKIKFNYSDQGKVQYYSEEFIRTFMLIKLNSLARPQCKINQEFLNSFAQFYNSKKYIKIQVSKNQCELFSQIIVQANLISSLDSNACQNILQGQALLATTTAIMIRESNIYLKKCQISFSLSFLALSGRRIAFSHLVHVQKNHKGQVYFADKIYDYIDIDSDNYYKIEVSFKRVQDPYSMRCSPQVYGIAYDTLWHIQENFKFLLNKFHFKNVLIDNKEYPNLDMHSDSIILQGDFLVCCLSQIGSISFLRCQRILNSYLGKNQLSKDSPTNLLNLRMLMERTVHCVSDNKIISTPSNIDTMNLIDYEKDVFYTQCKLYEKFEAIMQNLYKILHLQILASIQGLNNVYKIKEGQIFKNNTLKQQFFLLQENSSLKDKKKSHKFVKTQWQICC